MRREGKLYGYNTDIDGFIYMLSRAGVALAGKKVVILGSGGASLTAQAAAPSKSTKGLPDRAATSWPTVVLPQPGIPTRTMLVRSCQSRALGRALDRLPREGRPLSQKGNLTEMYRERLPLYQAAMDVPVQNDPARAGQ